MKRITSDDETVIHFWDEDDAARADEEWRGGDSCPETKTLCGIFLGFDDPRGDWRAPHSGDLDKVDCRFCHDAYYHKAGD